MPHTFTLPTNNKPTIETHYTTLLQIQQSIINLLQDSNSLIDNNLKDYFTIHNKQLTNFINNMETLYKLEKPTTIKPFC